VKIEIDQVNPDKNFSRFCLLRFFKVMGLFMIDTYLFVLMAVKELCVGNFVVREDNLVVELHNAIKDMHSESLVD
jgi:hypothetical protein